MINYLQSMQGMGNLKVDRYGDCGNRGWNIYWLTGGDKPQISVCTYTCEICNCEIFQQVCRCFFQTKTYLLTNLIINLILVI